VVVTDHIVSETKSSYQSALRRFYSFCTVRGLLAFPAEMPTVCAWLVWLSSSVAPLSMGSYIAALKYQHELEGYVWPPPEFHLLRRTLRYLKRKFPAKAAVAKAPITVALLRVILPYVPGWPDLAAMSADDRVFVVASVLAVAGFLRGGEFCFSASSSRPLLCISHISVRFFHPRRAVIVAVPQPKAQWWLESVDVPVYEAPDASADLFCPVRLWCTFFGLLSPEQRRPEAPAFPMASGAPISRDFMVRRTSGLMSQAAVVLVDATGRPLSVRASSWRAGAVRSAVEARVPTPFIKAYGRWSSDAWNAYLLQAGTDLQDASRAMWSSPQHGSIPHRQLQAVERSASSLMVEEDIRSLHHFGILT
jgi:hypothetical protein